jgi:hypothetical protein
MASPEEQRQMLDVQRNAGLGAMLVQFAPIIKSVADKLKPLIDQPVVRMPYSLGDASSLTIAAGGNGARFPESDFSHSLEWPFEVQRVRFSQDPSHGYRDWRVTITDQTFNQDWMKNALMPAQLVNANTGFWELKFPWIVRPKGGALIVSVNNLDTVNPITVDVSFEGALLIPRA